MRPDALFLAKRHQLYQRSSIYHSNLYLSKLAVVQFGNAGHRFASIKFLVHEGKPTTLIGVTANFPALLFGHNGRLLTTQDDMTLAFTILRSMIDPLVYKDDTRLILPGLDEDNFSHISSIECPLQFQDPRSELLLASHLSACRNFRKTSQIFPGESVHHKSSEVELIFYDKLAESRADSCVPENIPCTRVEVRFPSSRRLLSALGLSRSKNTVPAAIPIGNLFIAFREVIDHSLVGAPADPPKNRPSRLKTATRSILKLLDDKVGLLAALEELRLEKSHEEHGKIRRELFHELARLHPVSLPAMLKEFPWDLLSEVVRPDLEGNHELLKVREGWPTEPADDVVETFSKVRVCQRPNQLSKANRKALAASVTAPFNRIAGGRVSRSYTT